jgi:hypothetical protein
MEQQHYQQAFNNHMQEYNNQDYKMNQGYNIYNTNESYNINQGYPASQSQGY